MPQYPECNLLFVKKNSDKITIFNKSHVPAIIRGKLFYKLLRKKRLRDYYMPLIVRHTLISELFKLEKQQKPGKKTN